MGSMEIFLRLFMWFCVLLMILEYCGFWMCVRRSTGSRFLRGGGSVAAFIWGARAVLRGGGGVVSSQGRWFSMAAAICWLAV